jgi:hypothetical protein
VADWTLQQIKDSVKNCDGGTGVYAAAKQANGGNDPTVVVGHSATGGHTQMSTGTITLDPCYDKCYTIDTYVVELANLSHKADFERILGPDCAGGMRSREEYIKAIEKKEFEAVKSGLTAFDACKDKNGCKASDLEWARPHSASFDDYYKQVSASHKEHYGTGWDRRCKATYEAKHPSK